MRVPLRLLGLAVLGVVVAILGVLAGATTLAPGDVWSALAGADTPGAIIVRDIRFPRVLLGFLVGGGLGITGAALQAIVRNPLADPYLLGLSGGAGLGAVLAMAMRPGSPWVVPVAAFVGALGAVTLVYRLGRAAGGGTRLEPRVLVLGGVAVGSFAGAIMTAVLALSPAAELRNAFLWLLGGLGAASWSTVVLFGAYAVVPALLLLLRARDLDLLALGEEPAQYLGTDIERAKRLVYGTASLLTAASVAVCGVIGFVGLVIPHLTRRLVGPLHRVLLPAVFVTGGTLLVGADLVARTVARPIELPVGVVTALVGVPVFAMLLRRTAA